MTGLSAILMAFIILFTVPATVGKTVAVPPDIPIEGEVRFERVTDVLEGEVDGLYAEDLLLLLPYLGRMPEDVGIPDACVRYPYEGATYYSITVDGYLFGRHAYGAIDSGVVNEPEDRTMDAVRLYSYDLDYETLAGGLKALYGEPFDTGDEPYAAANGGAVHWERYRTAYGVICLDMGSVRDFMIIEFCANE